MARGTFDKEDEEPKKRGRPKKAAKATSAAKVVDGETATPEPTNKGAENGGQEEEKSDKKSGKKKEKARKVLRKAVKDAIRSRKTAIAGALIKKVIDGDKRSTEMMFSLIEKKNKDDAGEKRHGGLTAADLLGSEKEWESETAEVIEGQRSENRDQGSESEDQGEVPSL
jgi:hypothetical protein